MRKPVKEIENVLQNHGYSIDTIIFDVMKTFKLKTLCHQVGFKNLTLGLFDGKSFNPLDFSLHADKKQRHPKSSGAKRIRECNISKIMNGLAMLKRAVKQGFKANYVLVDSWFSSHDFIQTVRGLGKKLMHLLCGIRQDKRSIPTKGIHSMPVNYILS